MASKTTQSANDVVNYLVRNAAPSWDGATTLYVSLHTGAVGLGGDQTSNEVAYTGYARIPITRSGAGTFNAAAAGIAVTNALLQFGLCTGGTLPVVVTHAAIGENASGAGTVIVTGALSSSITVNINSVPQFAIGTMSVGEQ
jgi:hypothetical protein